MNDNLAVLRAQEDALRYPGKFGSAEALELGCAVAALAPRYERGFGVRIYRERDGLVLFQWMADDKAPRNLAFIDGKREAARLCGHASLWMWAEHEAVASAWAKVFDSLDAARSVGADGASTVCPAAGAFPIRDASGAWVATISASGLHHGQDHELVMRALCRVLGKVYGADVPVYPGVPR